MSIGLRIEAYLYLLKEAILKRLGRIIGILVFVGFVVSCTTFQLSGIQKSKATPSYQAVGQFEVTVVVHEFLGGPGGINLVNVTATRMDDKIFNAISREIDKFSGDAAVNITVEYQATFIDLLLNALTGSIYAPAHARVTGTVVKYQ